ncbi:polyadenylate-binding protein-interacting protein 2B isoform X1 [Ochotona princeps]|uniref:polyadenylate-binding protein-interacting protein 2B isoform X1 n=2 Tax=Ochotona princeps TaxID=9978 RepID=UPI00271543DC|nr:polyadenylate-binding protein-interacting protein 2B isoform X1 [Ochotona princeps]
MDGAVPGNQWLGFGGGVRSQFALRGTQASASGGCPALWLTFGCERPTLCERRRPLRRAVTECALGRVAADDLKEGLVPKGEREGRRRTGESPAGYPDLEAVQGCIIMNGSSMANTSPNVKSKEDQELNGHDEKENPFAEYMWMENEEDFNRQVEEELQEQDFLDRCFQEMLDEEDQDWFIPSRDLPQAMGQLQQQLNGLSVSDDCDSEDILSKSNLNPDAKEFIPGVKY